jgi:hypothetical protein
MRRTPWLLCLAVPSLALANPRPLPFTYPYETLAQGDVELEQFVDVTPAFTEADDGSREWSAIYLLTTEVEYGITDRLELGFYFAALTEPGVQGITFDGVKQRLRYRLLDSGDWPIDVSLYAEVAELHDEIELELKVNLQRRFGPVRVMVNLWGERAFDYHGGGAWVLHPTAGFTAELTHWLNLGAEYWMSWELGDTAHHYLGPALMVQWKKLWFSVAAYLRLENLGQAQVANDTFGRLWVRFVLGVNL